MDKEKYKKSLIIFFINLLKIIFATIIIVAIIVFIIPFIVNLIIETPNPFGLGFINDSNKDTWISFFGSIIGGGATLIGVYVTIKSQEEQRKNDLAIQYRPYLKIEKKDIQFNAITEKQPIYEPDENNEPIFIKDEIVDMSKFNVNISLKNIGRGEITKINISCTYRDDHISSNFKRKILDIMPEDSFNLWFDISLCDYEKFIYVDYDSTVNIQIDYFDFLNNKYHVEIPIYITNYPPNQQYDDGNNTFFYNIGEIIRFEMNK